MNKAILYPKAYFNSVIDITIEFLEQNKIKGLILDVDNTLIDYDVVEIINNKNIRVLYRDDSEDNAIVVTNQCN